MDCEIRVPAGDGGLRRDAVGPVSSFLKDSEIYYRAVWKHVKQCRRCDPAEVLRGFLANRDARHRGQTSALLVTMAEKYRRAMPDRVPAELVREFVIRCASSWEAFEDRVDDLSPEEIVRSHDAYMAAWKSEVLESADAARKKRGRGMTRSHPFARGQGSVGWLNDKERSHLGRAVPERTRRAAAMTREEAMKAGGRDLMIWLITRHSWKTTLEDPDVRYIFAVDMAEEIMDS